MLRYLNKKGQGTLEYAIIIAVVVAALIAMQVYIKRGLQGKLKQSSDEIGEQYSPGYTTATYATTSNVVSTETVTAGVQPTTSSTSTQTQSRTSNENVATSDQEYWPR